MERCHVCISGVCGPSPCPYCRSPSGMVHILPTYWPDGMDCQACEQLLDRGWFRAGRQCYLPLHDRVCCVPYQFRVDALRFEPSKAQARVVRNMQRFLSGEKSLAKNGTQEEPPRPTQPRRRVDTAVTNRKHILTCLLWEALQRLHSQGRVPLVPPEAVTVAQPRKALQKQRVVFYSNVCLTLGRASGSGVPPTSFPQALAASVTEELRALQPHWPAGITAVVPIDGFINFCSGGDAPSGPPAVTNGRVPGAPPEWSPPGGDGRGDPAVDVFRPFAAPPASDSGLSSVYSSMPPLLASAGSPRVAWAEPPSPWSTYSPTRASPLHRDPTLGSEESGASSSSSARAAVGGPRHTLNIAMVRPTVDTETYRLFKKYQRNVHQEVNWTYARFQTEFVDSPLPHSSPYYGTFHVQYRLDHQLIMVGVVDILPHCLCSCYLFYDTDYRALALGKYSALWELNWIKQKAGTEVYPALRYYYLGSYVHGCHKVNYKAEYGPAELLCPVTLKWVALPVAQQLLETQRPHVACTRLADLDQWPGYSESPLVRQEISEQEACEVLYVVFNQAIQRLADVRAQILQSTKPYNVQRLYDIMQAANALGRDLATRVAFAARFDGPADEALMAFEEEGPGPPHPNPQVALASDEDTDADPAASESSAGTERSSASAPESGGPAGPQFPEGGPGPKEPPSPKKPKIRHNR